MRCQKCPPAPQRAARLHGGSRKHILMVVWVLDLAVSLEGSVDMGLSSYYIRHLEWIPWGGGDACACWRRAELGCRSAGLVWDTAAVSSSAGNGPARRASEEPAKKHPLCTL